MLTRLSFLTSGLGALIPSFMRPKTTPKKTIAELEVSIVGHSDFDQVQMQAVACMMAAEGNEEALDLKRGDWAWSPALDAVQRLYAFRQMVAHEALGYAYAYACACVDAGRDIRKIALPQIVEEASEALGWENNVHFIRCPECSDPLFTYRPKEYEHRIPVDIKWGKISCTECGWVMTKEPHAQG